MPLARYVKSQVERKRYEINYANWLAIGETITRVEFSVTQSGPATTGGTPLQVDAYSIATPVVVYFVSFGDDNTNYVVDVRITTNTGQYKEDTVLFSVRNP